ncbi:MAG: hypothetical protein WC462_03665 [archaeon]
MAKRILNLPGKEHSAFASRLHKGSPSTMSNAAQQDLIRRLNTRLHRTNKKISTRMEREL